MTDKQFNELITFIAIGFSVLVILIGVSTAAIIRNIPQEKEPIESHKVSTTVETDNLTFE